MDTEGLVSNKASHMSPASQHLSLPTWSLFLIRGQFICSVQLPVSLGKSALEEGSNTPISLQ